MCIIAGAFTERLLARLQLCPARARLAAKVAFYIYRQFEPSPSDKNLKYINGVSQFFAAPTASGKMKGR